MSKPEAEQYWTTKEQVEAWEAERTTRVQELHAIHAQVATLRWGPDRDRLLGRQWKLQEEIRQLNAQIKQANLLETQRELSAYDLDPNDPRGLLVVATRVLRRLGRQIYPNGERWDEELQMLLIAIERYQQHSYVRPTGTVRFVREQVDL